MTENQRLDSIERRRQKLVKKLKSPAPSKKKQRLPGEVEKKKVLAVILRVANYEFSNIGASLNESESTIKNWFTEPEVKELYEVTLERMTEGALMLLQTYQVEAIQTIVEIMRDTNDEKIALDAAKEILDRSGIPKVTKSDKHVTHENTLTLSGDKVVENLRELTPQEREHAAQLIEELEETLNVADK